MKYSLLEQIHYEIGECLAAREENIVLREELAESNRKYNVLLDATIEHSQINTVNTLMLVLALEGER